MIKFISKIKKINYSEIGDLLLLFGRANSSQVILIETKRRLKYMQDGYGEMPSAALPPFPVAS